MLGSMVIDNEDGADRSARITSSWSAKRSELEGGERPRVRAPSWLTYNNGTYELNDKASIVRTVFDVYLECG